MLNGKFVANRDYGRDIFTKGVVYEFVDGVAIANNGFETSKYGSLDDFYERNGSFRGGFEPYIEESAQHNQPTHTVNITKNLGDDDVKMKFTYDDGEESVEYAVIGGEIDYVPNMINHYVQFLTHLGFSEITVLKFMRKYVEDSEI